MSESIRSLCLALLGLRYVNVPAAVWPQLCSQGIAYGFSLATKHAVPVGQGAS